MGPPTPTVSRQWKRLFLFLEVLGIIKKKTKTKQNKFIQTFLPLVLQSGKSSMNIDRLHSSWSRFSPVHRPASSRSAVRSQRTPRNCAAANGWRWPPKVERIAAIPSRRSHRSVIGIFVFVEFVNSFRDEGREFFVFHFFPSRPALEPIHF